MLTFNVRGCNITDKYTHNDRRIPQVKAIVSMSTQAVVYVLSVNTGAHIYTSRYILQAVVETILSAFPDEKKISNELIPFFLSGKSDSTVFKSVWSQTSVS